MAPRRPFTLLVALLACSACAARSKPPLEQELAEMDATRQVAPTALRVMSFNIKSGGYGLDKVAEVINLAHPEVVALQEVDVGTDRSHGLDQAAELGRLTHMPYAHHFRATTLHGGAYGVALLSRLPVKSVEQRMLPVDGHEPRTAVHAVLDLQGREVSVYFTHLSMAPFDPQIRTRQSQILLAWMASDPRPKLLLGDLNSTAHSQAVEYLSAHLTDALAQCSRTNDTYRMPILGSGAMRIDYVLADSGFKPLSAEVLHCSASDHFPVVADVALAPIPGPAVAATPEPAPPPSAVTHPAP